jgi:histidinol-phosphatase (PHP family)
MKMSRACERAAEVSLRQIAFTEHLDLFYPKNDITWKFDVPAYVRNVSEMQERWIGKLEVLTAIEVGLHPQTYKESKEFTSQHPFDFVLGSVHIVGNYDLHNGDYFKDKTDDQAVKTWFENLNRCVKEYPDFHVLGHLDLIRRYAHYLKAPEQIDWHSYDDMIEDTLKILIGSERGIEINLSGYHTGLNAPMPDLRIIKRYREMHGEVITVGSDAHSPECIGAKLDYGYYLLQQAGFKYLTIFKGGIPEWVALKNISNY